MFEVHQGDQRKWNSVKLTLNHYMFIDIVQHERIGSGNGEGSEIKLQI